MDLRSLIESLTCSYKAGSMSIPNVEKILGKLEEMDAMVEMESVKNSFVSQLLLILLMRQRGCVPPFRKMHTVFSGPPGVGKTSMSILVAQIWSLLNILDKRFPLTKTDSPLLEKVDSVPIEKDYAATLTPDMKIKYKRDIAHIMIDVRDKIQDMMLSLDLKYGDSEPDDIPDFVKNIYSKSHDTSDLCDTIVDKYSKYFYDIDEEDIPLAKVKVPLEEPYIVLGRGDFIGSHVGETSLKTEAILKKNKGKVIIIEEAYLLYNGERDSFGMEALTLINRYMDEHSDDYIFIFNGYEDHLNRTIFKAQPGLRRRIQWTFNIEKYSPDGIFKIFKHQLCSFDGPEWKICPEDEASIKKIFIKSTDLFPYFGGDTEKLILDCQLEYGRKHFCFQEPMVSSDCVITLEIFTKAFEIYKKKNPGLEGKMPVPSFMYI
jgi:DNA polymerase III delta prime subunit